MDRRSLAWDLWYIAVPQAEEGMSLTAVWCGWFRGTAIHYFITDLLFVFKQNFELQTSIYKTFLHRTKSDQRTSILHLLGLWRNKAWNCSLVSYIFKFWVRFVIHSWWWIKNHLEENENKIQSGRGAVDVTEIHFGFTNGKKKTPSSGCSFCKITVITS